MLKLELLGGHGMSVDWLLYVKIDFKFFCGVLIA